MAAATLGPQSSVSVAESPRPSICSPPQRGICLWRGQSEGEKKRTLL